MSPSASDLQVILNKRPWRVSKGVGSFMLFEFGRPRRTEDGARVGTYTLWIYMAEWRIRNGRRELAHCNSPEKTINRVATALTGQKLEAIILRTYIAKRSVRHGVLFGFEGGYALSAWAYARPKDRDDIFFLITPAGGVFYLHDGTFSSDGSLSGEG